MKTWLLGMLTEFGITVAFYLAALAVVGITLLVR